MTSSSHPIDSAFEGLQPLIERDPALQSELARAVAEFGHGEPDAPAAAASWHRRLLEWFVLERASGSLRAPPLEELLDAARERGEELVASQAAGLRGSQVGIFRVTGVEPERGLWLKDLASRGEYPISEPGAALLFQRGDLIAGRIFPLDDGSWHVSCAAAFFRDDELARALESDLEKARSARRGFVRISQLELERMFFLDSRATQDDALAAARALLVQGGVEAEEIERIFERFAQAPFDRERVVHGADDVLAEVLDRLAFETAIDLDHARRLLMLAWSQLAHRGPGSGAALRPAPPPRPERREREAGVRTALDEFERARAQGQPLDTAFAELEAELGLELDASEDEAEPAPDFPGVVGAVIEEFLWEVQRQEDQRAAELESVRLFGSFAAHVGVLENLSTRDLLAYACHWLPESGALGDADAARAHLSALNAFLRWTDEEQGLAIHAAFKPTLRGLESSLPRIVEANRRRTRASDPASGELFECVGVLAPERLRLRDKAGDEFEADVDPELVRWLRAGDRMRARLHEDGRLAVYCCYPPEARGLSTR